VRPEAASAESGCCVRSGGSAKRPNSLSGQCDAFSAPTPRVLGFAHRYSGAERSLSPSPTRRHPAAVVLRAAAPARLEPRRLQRSVPAAEDPVDGAGCRVPIARRLPIAAGRGAAMLPVPALHRFDDPRARPAPLRSPGRPGWLEAGSRDGRGKRAEASDDHAGARPASPLGHVAGRAGVTSGGVSRRPITHPRGRSGLRRPLPDPLEDQLARPRAPLCARAASASHRSPGAATAATGRPATVVAAPAVAFQPLAVAAPVGVAAIDVDRRPSEAELLGDLICVEPATLEPLDLRGPFGTGATLNRRTICPLSGSPQCAVRASWRRPGHLGRNPRRADRRLA
jgi:hypothetical protein